MSGFVIIDFNSKIKIFKSLILKMINTISGNEYWQGEIFTVPTVNPIKMGINNLQGNIIPITKSNEFS